MRSHGVPNFPDPYMGHMGWSLDSGVDPNTPQFKAAWAYCAARYVHFPKTTPAERAERNAAAEKFSQCMRAHGATGFPDPDGTGLIHVPTEYYMQSPLVVRVQKSCNSTDVAWLSPYPSP